MILTFEIEQFVAKLRDSILHKLNAVIGLNTGIVAIIGTILLVLGIMLLFKDSFMWGLENLMWKMRKNMKESVLDIHLDNVISANNLPSWVTVFRFKVLTVVSFSTIFLWSVQLLYPPTALTLSMSISLSFYIMMRVRLARLRGRGSYEAETVVGDFLGQYSIKRGNVEEALEMLLNNRRIIITRPAIRQLVYKIRAVRNDDELRRACDAFAYAVGTNWGRMLAGNIYIAKSRNLDIYMSINDIVYQLREARNILEEQKRDTSEPKRLLFFLPILYFGLMYMGVGMMDKGLPALVKAQLMTDVGLTGLLWIILGSLGSVALYIVLFSRKFDF